MLYARQYSRYSNIYPFLFISVSLEKAIERNKRLNGDLHKIVSHRLICLSSLYVLPVYISTA